MTPTPIDIPKVALSIRQPWAWLIVHGHKTFENRTWTPRYPARKHLGPFLVHASRAKVLSDYIIAEEICARLKIKLPLFEELRRGGIIGMANVDAWHDSAPAGNPFAFYSGLALSGAQELPWMPCKGVLGFFAVDYQPREPFSNPQLPLIHE